MSEVIDETYLVQTSIGIFYVEYTTSYRYNNTYLCNTLTVSSEHYCVNLKYSHSRPTTAELQWRVTDRGRSNLVDISLHDEIVRHLLYLAVTVLKTYLPQIIILMAIDTGNIQCDLPHGQITQIHLSKYYFILYGKSWYELLFSATSAGDHTNAIYTQKQTHYNDPKYKPQVYDFENTDLNIILPPIFETCASWAEFGERISNNFKPSCAYVAPWYLTAVAHIMDKRSFPEYWDIDVQKYPRISYTRLTYDCNCDLKQRRFININDIEGPIMSPDELYNIKYT